MYKEIFFDVETKKLFNEVEREDPGLLGVSLVSVYSRKIDDNFLETGGRMESFWESDFDRMWPLFSNADRVIGFNTLGFDNAALQPYTSIPLDKLPNLDIMYKFKEAIGHRISLDSLAKENLGSGKTDDGLNAVLYWQKGDKESLEKLQMYCEADVLITKELYDLALKNKHLMYKDKWNTLRRVDLDFSYPEPEEKAQIGLF